MSHIGLPMQDDATDRRRGRSRAPVVIAVVVVLAVVAVVVGGAVYFTRGGDYTGDGQGQVIVEIPKGASLSRIADVLAEAGVVKSASAFVDVAADDARAKKIGPGAYELRLQMSAAAALDLLVDPASAVNEKVVLPEGLRKTQSITAIAKGMGLSEAAVNAAVSAAEASPGPKGVPVYAQGSAEGFLYPATYTFAPDASAETAVAAILARYRQAADDLDLVARAKQLGITPYQVIVMASLVTGESGPADYPKVARVIYNRLRIGMPLQLDSTVNYGLGIANLKLTAEQLAAKTPYNTYLFKGLPPGPINSPGSDAIEAVLAPASGSWLYFVTTDPAAGVTKFATTYAEFLLLKKEFQQSGQG